VIGQMSYGTRTGAAGSPYPEHSWSSGGTKTENQTKKETMDRRSGEVGEERGSEGLQNIKIKLTTRKTAKKISPWGIKSEGRQEGPPPRDTKVSRKGTTGID